MRTVQIDTEEMEAIITIIEYLTDAEEEEDYNDREPEERERTTSGQVWWPSGIGTTGNAATNLSLFQRLRQTHDDIGPDIAVQITGLVGQRFIDSCRQQFADGLLNPVPYIGTKGNHRTDIGLNIVFHNRHMLDREVRGIKMLQPGEWT
jgi:hypothetical protein